MKRRSAGEGNIYQRADGRWVGRLRVGWRNGRLARGHFYGATQDEVREKLLKARVEKSQGLPIVKRQTVHPFLERWLEQTLRPNAKPRSAESFSMIVRKHIVPLIGRVRLDKLTPQHVAGMLETKRKSGLAPQTLVNIRTVLRSALARRSNEDWSRAMLQRSSMRRESRVPRSMLSRPRRRGGCWKQAVAIVSRPYSLWRLRSQCGAAKYWACDGRTSDFDNRVIRVTQALQRLSTGLTLTDVKTERSRRVLAMPDSVVRALKLRRARQAQERLLAGSRWQDTGLCFTGADGKPLEPITLHRAYKALLAKAGLPTAVRFHDLRHSAASLLLAQGVHLRVLMEMLGHSSISLTANTYSHVMPAAMRDVADKMEAISGG